jgi:hypothetical protein
MVHPTLVRPGDGRWEGVDTAVAAPTEAPTVDAAPRRRGRRVALAVLIVLVGYLVLTFANPRIVPRLRVLPKPEGRGHWFDDCNGRPGNRHQEWWEASGPFWTRAEFATVAGCIRPEGT